MDLFMCPLPAHLLSLSHNNVSLRFLLFFLCVTLGNGGNLSESLPEPPGLRRTTMQRGRMSFSRLLKMDRDAKTYSPNTGPCVLLTAACYCSTKIHP